MRFGGRKIVKGQLEYLLEASERGTRRYSKTALREKMARLGSAIAVSPMAIPIGIR